MVAATAAVLIALVSLTTPTVLTEALGVCAASGAGGPIAPVEQVEPAGVDEPAEMVVWPRTSSGKGSLDPWPGHIAAPQKLLMHSRASRCSKRPFHTDGVVLSNAWSCLAEHYAAQTHEATDSQTTKKQK